MRGAGAIAVTVLDFARRGSHRYGRITATFRHGHRQCAEQRDATPEQAAINEINAGIYAFDAFLRDALSSLGTGQRPG